MDGVNLLSDQVASDWYAKIAQALAEEWAFVKRSRNPALIEAHARLHYLLADLATALGVSAPQASAGTVQPMSGGGDKPPPPQ